MARASRELKTPLLGHIIQNYTSPSFGFASKNFFAEFVAAVNTYDYLTRNNKIEPAKPYSPTLEVSLNRPMNLSEVAKHSRISFDAMRELNPCLERMFETQRFQNSLPQNYVLRLPTASVKNMQQHRVSITIIDKPWNRYARR
jgi:membrane-bound lytic murein transglycosylase D